MVTIENKAFEAYQEDRAKAPKYHTPDSCWMDWYKKGYRKAEQEMKEKALQSFCKQYSKNSALCQLSKKTDNSCTGECVAYMEFKTILETLK